MLEPQFNTARIWTARALKENPELRSINQIENLVAKVREMSKMQIPFNTIDRNRRRLQNDLKMYLPEEEDERILLEEIYREEFRR